MGLPKDVLLVGKRLEILSSLQRTPRQYWKIANSYWSSGINKGCAKRPHLCNHEPTVADWEGNMTNMTADEIRA